MAERHAQSAGINFFSGEGFGCIQYAGGLLGIAGVGKNHCRLGLKGDLGQRLLRTQDQIVRLSLRRLLCRQAGGPGGDLDPGETRHGQA